MTRIVNGFYDDVVVDSGFFISDADADLLCSWLAAYADALEKAWIRNGSQGSPKAAKHAKVRSFIAAVARGRDPDRGQKKKSQNPPLTGDTTI